jgi:UDP-N-acetylglucosamine:LPS N-acetylglucosamine transferase
VRQSRRHRSIVNAGLLNNCVIVIMGGSVGSEVDIARAAAQISMHTNHPTKAANPLF